MKGRIHTGEIYWIKLEGSGSLQNGWHPGVVVQNNIGNKYSDTVVIVPLTSRKKSKLPTHVNIRAGAFGLAKDSIVQCEGQRPVNKTDIGDYIGTVDDKTMGKIARCCLINTPYLAYLTYSEIDMMCSKIAC
ncbi:mRNA interferase MazF [Clostridiales Family XIII bacterium PM5-7]